MDSTKLDISGKPNNKDDSSSYRQIPDADLDEESSVNLKPLVKSKVSGGEKDGADEKMLPDEKVGDNSNVNAADVKFISNEKQNGDAKVDIGELTTVFVGMGKEELMKYANDPFWVRLRWFLFILFWLLWAGMLIGAIMIIVAAPKCSPPEPRTWWEQGPLTEVDAEATADELSLLKEDGIQGVIVTWPEDAYTPLNVSNKFLTFLSRAKDVSLNVIVDLKPGVSSQWFYKSENEEDSGKFIDYYIWAPSKTFDSTEEPPNNWKSRRNTTSWLFSSIRHKFYLSPEETPQLNFNNPKVVDEFSAVLTNFIDAGAKGFRLTGVPSLLVDKSLRNEPLSPLHGYGLTDYGFYKHTNTEYLPELGSLIKQWRDIVKNKTEGGPFMLSENLKNLDVFKVNNSVMVDLPFRPRVFGPNKQLTAVQINSDLNSTFLFLENKYWPLWQHNNSALPSDVLTIVTLLLPGTTLLNKNTTVPKELYNIRKSPSIMHGNTERYLVANKTVFVYSRLTPGNPGYLIALNPSSNRVVVDFPAEIPSIPEEITVQFFSSNYNETNIVLKKKADAHNIPLSPESALVMSFVPQS